jgi:carbon-monoxide dehydrogenase large subunit
VIGASVRRVEDRRFLEGSGRFIDDLAPAGTLHCVLVRSPHPHARIVSIDVAAGVTAFTGKDMAADGVGPMRAGWRVGADMHEAPRWPLARDTVRHVGEPVAAVFAETRALAEDAAERVAVEYEPLALLKDDLCFRWTRGDLAAVERVFAERNRKIKIELVNNRLCGAAIETRGALATGDTLYVGTQSPHHIRRYVCDELGIDEGKLRVVSRDMGGGCGGR